ncbi:MAG: hypothetical protein SGARI_003264 [Bacillariaceae sp.]
MRFLLHPTSRAAVHSAARRVAGKKAPKLVEAAPKCHVVSATSLSEDAQASARQANSNALRKSWGQQCSPDCGCIVRFEASVDPSTQRIVAAKYVAKSVLTTVDHENGGRLAPVYTSRTNRPMFQECSCSSVHKLAKEVTSYLPNKRLDQIQGWNDFTFTRSSEAFRHAVLAQHDLPRHHTQCFDVVEEAFTGMVNNTVPARRKVRSDYQRILKAQYMQEPLIVQSYFQGGDGGTQYQEEYVHSNSRKSTLGSDTHRLSMSSPRTMSTLRMFDINADYWDDEEHTKEGAKRSGHDRFDWVSYVDQQYENAESA